MRITFKPIPCIKTSCSNKIVKRGGIPEEPVKEVKAEVIRNYPTSYLNELANDLRKAFPTDEKTVYYHLIIRSLPPSALPNEAEIQHRDAMIQYLIIEEGAEKARDLVYEHVPATDLAACLERNGLNRKRFFGLF